MLRNGLLLSAAVAAVGGSLRSSHRQRASVHLRPTTRMGVVPRMQCIVLLSQGLFYSPNINQSYCPRGGTHTSGNGIVQSYNYAPMTIPT